MSTRSLIILGATGDLTRRLLLPALDGVLEHLESTDVDTELELIGAGHCADGADEWNAMVASAFGDGPMRTHTRLASRYVSADATRVDDLRRIIDSAMHTPILYFALPPAVTEEAIEALASMTLPAGTRLVLEKPFARDLESAELLNERLAALAPESSIHRDGHQPSWPAFCQSNIRSGMER